MLGGVGGIVHQLCGRGGGVSFSYKVLLCGCVWVEVRMYCLSIHFPWSTESHPCVWVEWTLADTQEPVQCSHAFILSSLDYSITVDYSITCAYYCVCGISS